MAKWKRECFENFYISILLRYQNSTQIMQISTMKSAFCVKVPRAETD